MSFGSPYDVYFVFLFHCTEMYGGKFRHYMQDITCIHHRHNTSNVASLHACMIYSDIACSTLSITSHFC